MKYLTASALAALLVGSMSLGGLVPARADDAATTTATSATAAATTPTADRSTDTTNRKGWRMNRRHMDRTGGRSGGLFNFSCSPRSAEALEIGLVRVKYAVQPTAAQIPLFDALRTAALDSQKTFANSCTTTPAASAANPASIVDRLQRRLDLDTARVAALGEVMPKLKAFYDSLTPEQQKALQGRGLRGPGQRGGMKAWQRASGTMPHARMHQRNQPTETNPASTGSDTTAPAATDQPASGSSN